MQHTFKIDGMTCGGCASSVRKVLDAQPGVTGAEVDLAAAEARFDYDPAQTPLASIQQAIEDAGYDVVA